MTFSMRILLFLILLQLTTVGCCKSGDEDMHIKQVLTEIESDLGIKKEGLEIQDRLLSIRQRIKGEINYEISVFTIKRQDTIQYGDSFEAILIPVRTYDNEVNQRVAVSIADSTWLIERPSYDNTLYLLKSSHYNRGKNEVNGIMPVGKDTLPFVFDFTVK